MSRERFAAKFLEQLQSIQLSCSAFDSGQEHEAVRLAVSLRVLFHTKGRSTCLMDHLKMQDAMLVSSDIGHNDWRAYVKTSLNLGSATPIKSLPRLEGAFVELPLRKWWDEQTVYRHEGKEYQRRQLVLAAAEQDGGAHVDAKVERFYEVLASGIGGLGMGGENLVYPGRAPYDVTVQQHARNTHLAMIRQFAYEVLVSANHFRWLATLHN